MEIPRGKGFQKPKFFKKSIALKWNFQRGCWVEAKKPSVGGLWIFYGITHCSCSCQFWYEFQIFSDA